MKLDRVRRLTAGTPLTCGPFAGVVTCVDLTDDDKIVVKWDCCESEDVLCVTSPLWQQTELLT